MYVAPMLLGPSVVTFAGWVPLRSQWCSEEPTRAAVTQCSVIDDFAY